MKNILRVITIGIAITFAFPLFGQKEQSPPDKHIYMVANAHFDTQWRWTVQQTIREFLPNTFHQNFALLEQYPNYKFSFEGAIKYLWIKEYYPNYFEKLKEYVAEGRWYPAGASWDANDFNVPSIESAFRNILLGNEFYKKEFGIVSRDIMLPDCFGFGYALPTVAKHCGVYAFHTQKLQWRHHAHYDGNKKYPFEFGLWEGIDGSRLLAVPNGHDYFWSPEEEVWDNEELLGKVNESKLGAAMRYFGTRSSRLHGDQGGSPLPLSVKLINQSIPKAKDYSIRFARTIDIFNDYKHELDQDNLPIYKGELLMDVHGTGCYTSKTDVKTLNRRAEQLGLAAEGSAVMADWAGAVQYPHYVLNDAYSRIIWHQFHDDLTGTSIHEAYPFTWNDYMIAQNQFTGVIESSVAGLARSMDTRTKGQAVAMFNPVTAENNEVVELSLDLPSAKSEVWVYDNNGKRLKSQVLEREGKKAKVLVAGELPSMGVSIYDIRFQKRAPSQSTSIKLTNNTIENSIYKVTVDADGEISSIIDKRYGKELVAKGETFGYHVFEDNESNEWPAWEILKSVIDRKPAKVKTDVKITIEEEGPLRGVLRVERRFKESTFVQRIMLYDGAEDDRIDVHNHVDWRSQRTLLKAAFPMSVGSKVATYDLGIGHIQRGNNTKIAYEVPAQQWADITAEDGSYGITIMNDSRYGWDKPNDNTLRLTLIHTPTADRHWNNAKTLDIGPQEFTYSIVGHLGELEPEDAALASDKLNQRKAAVAVPSHPGTLGKSISMVGTSDNEIRVRAFKKAEDGDGYIVRIYELEGDDAEETIIFATDILSADVVNGIEEYQGPAKFDGNRLYVEIGKFAPATFRVRLKEPVQKPLADEYTKLALEFDKVAISSDAFSALGRMDNDWHSYAAELIPEEIVCKGVPFEIGEADFNNALMSDGQKIKLPEGTTGVYLLLASSEKDMEVEFNAGTPVVAKVPYYSGFFGSGNWDQYTAYLKEGQIAYVGNHRHDSRTRNEAYVQTYMFVVYVPVTSKEIKLPKNKELTIFAVTAVKENLPQSRLLTDMVTHIERW